MWFTANPNGEAESLRVYLRPKPKLKKLILEFDFATLAIKNRGSMGNIVTKNPVQKIMLKANGTSTIGGKQMWFDWDINRLNEDGRGELLGEFRGEEHILAICKDGTFYTNKLDLSSRFQGEVMKVVKLDTDKIYTAVYWDGELKCFYIKRFTFEISDNSVQNFISESKGSFLKEISQDKHPRIQISFGKEGKKEREPETIEAESFIGVKGVKAKGKRLSSYPIETILFLEPALEEISIDTFDLNDDLLDSDLPEKNNSKESYPPGTSIEIDLDSDDLTLF